MTKSTLAGVILDETIELTVEELCVSCSESAGWVVELVEEGVIEPIDPSAAEWRFSGPTITRAHMAMRLGRDLDINLPGIALALDLLDEIQVLRERLKRHAGDDRQRGRHE